MCIVIHIIALLLVIAIVKNNSTEETKLKMFEGVFYPKDITENLKTLVKKREGYKRLILILTFLVTPLFIVSMTGETSVFYLYTRYKFDMTEHDYDYFVTYRRLLFMAGLIPMIIIFFVIFKLTDVTFGLVASLVQIVSGICSAIAHYQWQLLGLSMLEPVRGVVTVTSRSLLTKSVDANELGRVTSLQSALETFLPIISIPLYSSCLLYTSRCV